MYVEQERRKAPLTVVPGDRRLHSLSLKEKVNAPLKPEWGEAGVSNDWCIIIQLFSVQSHVAVVHNVCIFAVSKHCS